MNPPENSDSPGECPQDPPLPTFPWTDDIEKILARFERRLIEHALQSSNGVKRRAAHLLGISRYALERRLIRVAKTLDDPDLGQNGRSQVTSAVTD